MTTIVYCHKTKLIAVDSRVTESGGFISSDKKDKTTKNDLGLWFTSGKVSDHVDLVKLKHNQSVDIVPSCGAFLIKDKSIFLVEVSSSGMCTYEKLTCNDGMGTGGKLALAALDFGKTAKEAVEYAATKDCYTGGKVRVFNLDGEEVL